jgi:type VI secretion system protein
MLLTLRILSYRNQPVPGAVAGRFSDAGGTLGRSPDNALVLDDPGKYISRVHARVSFREGAFFLEDLGSNASVINDRPLGKGREIQLGDGDRVTVGDYQLQAVLEAAPVAAPLLPPAPLNNADLPLFVPPPPPAPVHLPPLEPVAEAARGAAYAAGLPDALAGASILDVGPADLFGAPGHDPLGLNLFGSGAAQAAPAHAADSDHLSPELAAFQMPQPASVAAPPIQAASPAFRPADAFAIPHDYDPLADFLPRAVAPAVPASPVAPASSVVPASTAAPASNAAPATNGAPASNATPATNAAPASNAAPATNVAPASNAAPATNVAPASSATPATNVVPAQAGTPFPRSAAPSPDPAPPAQPATDTEILQALLRGLGLPDLKLNRSGPEVAETVGAMLREATAGTIDVLMARAMTKKESRIEMTMLSVRANNPLKFFPNADGALTQMLTNSMSGYLPPVEAMASAFDDLRAHELAVIAGMRAALAAVLHRFDPAQIERRLAVPTVMDKMLSANRKAKLWDGLVELYGEIAREADDDLQRLFGEKFSEAYEEQVARLRQAKGK